MRRRDMLLVSGVGAAALYLSMTILVGLRWEGYSNSARMVSELSAIDAPTRPLWLVLGVVYSGLAITFSWLVWRGGGTRARRAVGALLLAQSVFGACWPPMHQRAVLAAGGATLTDTLHLVWTGVTGVLFMAALACGAAAFGRRFRVYSLVTLLVVFGTGAWTGTYASAMQADLPTPMAGMWERTNIAAVMLWIAVLAVVLARQPAAHGTG